MSLFKFLEKKEQPIVRPTAYLKGAVKFIHKGSLVEGVVFGKPYNNGALINPEWRYHVAVGDKVYEVPLHAIEEINGEN